MRAGVAATLGGLDSEGSEALLRLRVAAGDERVEVSDVLLEDPSRLLGDGGTAGLFLLIKKMTTDKVLADLKGVGGTVMRTSFESRC